MDPESTLWEPRALLAAYGASGAGEVPEEQAWAERLAELVEALDECSAAAGSCPDRGVAPIRPGSGWPVGVSTGMTGCPDTAPQDGGRVVPPCQPAALCSPP